MNIKEWQCDVCKKYSEDVYAGNEAAVDHDKDFFYNFLSVYRKAKKIAPNGKVNMRDVVNFQVCKECLK